MKTSLFRPVHMVPIVLTAILVSSIYSAPVAHADPSSDATVTSGSYTVDSDANTITTVPMGTSKADFLSALTAASGASLDASGINDPVVSNDTLVVTAEDTVTMKTYTITTVFADTTIEVNDAGDEPLADGATTCQTALDNDICTLRAALQEANLTIGSDPITISFNISGAGSHTITLDSNLPTLNRSHVTIDGRTQSGTACGDLWDMGTRTLNVVIDGDGTRDFGLDIDAASTTIEGLVLTNFAAASVVINLNDSGSGVVSCNNLSDAQNGIAVDTGGNNILIGGPNAGDGNVISGMDQGMHLKGILNSVIEGNFVGVDVTGSTADANGEHSSGIFFGVGAVANMVRHNLISGNTGSGINVGFGVGDPAIEDTTIVANYIGTDRTGLVAIPNVVGISIGHAASTTVGGTDLLDRNIIAGNTSQAVFTNSQATEVHIIGNHIGLAVNGTTVLCDGNPEIDDGASDTTAIGNIYGAGCNYDTTFGVSLSASTVNVGDELTFSVTDAPDFGSGTLSLYVCKTADGTSSGCAGGVSETWCSTTGAIGDPSCSVTSTSDDVGIHTAYAYIYKTDYDIPNGPVSSLFVTNSSSGTGLRSTTFLIQSAADDGTAYKIDEGGYPPSGDAQFDIDGAMFSLIVAGRTQALPNGILNMLLRWDTSSLPDNATIIGASISCLVSPSGFFNTDNRHLTGDWYSGPFTGAAYSETPVTGALTSYALSGISVGSSPTLNTVPLDVATGVNLVGTTTLRLTIDGGEPSDGGGLFTCSTYGSGNPVGLTVTYTVPSGSEETPSPTGGSSHHGGSSIFTPRPAPSSSGLSGGQINSLLAILTSFGADPATLAQVQAILSGTTHTPPPTSFTHDLTLGSTGEDVKLLQHYLNTHGYPISLIGPGSLNQETTLFGSKTQQALIKYQKAHDITPALGYFGVKTRGVVNSGI